MKRTFVFQEGNSQKFWSIEVKGTDFTVTYGRLGTAGQSQTKSFETKEKCQKESDKLIAEKTKKGYKELGSKAVMPDKVDAPKGFQFTKEQKAILKEQVEDEEITREQAQLFEKFCEKHAVPCYYLKIVKGESTPLDSSIGGIPYCPVGEELPKDKGGNKIPLFIQINFEGIDLPGYPNKGIFQLFMGDNDDGTEYYEDVIQSGSRTRYYESTTAKYRKDIPSSNHKLLVGNRAGKRHFKLKLEKGWSMYPFGLSSFLEDDMYIFKGCEIYKQLFEKDEELGELLCDIWEDLFPYTSNIGGYGCSPQGQASIPRSVARSKKEGTLLFLGGDLISWGDGGTIDFFYEDITKLKKDQSLWGYGDMC